MKKAVLISIQPRWCELIASGKKSVEVRKTRPKLKTPFKVYIYCTKPKTKHDWGLCLEDGKVDFVCNCNYDAAIRNGMKILSGKIIGEFVCNEIECFTTDYRADFEQTKRISKQSCVSPFALEDYEQGSRCLYGWHISNLVIYDKPKELSEFRKTCVNELYCESCAMYNNFYDSCGNKALRLKRPPQSWCYVEELSE